MTDPTPAEHLHPQPVPLPAPTHQRRFAPPLPAPLTSFVGREGEVAALATLLRHEGARLVTLTGPGGVGKTRIALAAAAAMESDFEDGVAFASLAQIADPALVGPTIAQAVGVRSTGDRPLAERLAIALRDTELLLVLDNCEHMLDAAPLVAGLLAACPRLAVLATSREVLHVSPEHAVAVDPLAQPEAERLFATRARAARADFVVTDANASAIAEICCRLEGLPLAIELAAARIAHLPPVALLARLDRRLPLLTGGARDLPERQQTMRSAVAWSHDLLTPEEQGLFRRLSVFTGGCTLEAAEAVAIAPGEPVINVLDGLASLVAKSLLRQTEDPSGEPRYLMLETVREYGLEQLTAHGEEATVRDQHAHYFVALAERADPAIWGGPDHGRWLDRLEAELANLRAALAWLEETGNGASFLRLAAALGGLWSYRSYLMEGREWLRRALAMGGDTAPAARAMALVKLTILEGALGGTPAPELAAEAVALRRALGDERGVASALNVLAGVLERRFEHDRAGQLRAEATAIRERLGDLNGLAHSRSGFARIALEHGDVDRAEILYTEALDLFRRDGFPYGIASVLLALGGIEADRGNTAGAAVRFAESLRLCGEIRSQALLVDALAATGRLAAMAGWAEAAARVLGAAAALGEALGCVSPPKEQAWRQSASSAACATLGEHACTAARAAGRTLSPERAVAEAAAVLTVVSSLPPPARSHRAGAILFTSREQDVLRLLVEGSSDREIAEALGLSYRTVTSHVRNILGKLDVASRTAAATQAVRRGLV